MVYKVKQRRLQKEEAGYMVAIPVAARTSQQLGR